MQTTSSKSNHAFKRVWGRSGLHVGPIGLGSSYGAPCDAYEEAFERGCNYFYWGSFRRDGMAQAIRKIAPTKREQIVVALQSYTRLGFTLPWGVHRGLRSLR